MATNPDRREYYRQRYLHNRERILEKQKAYGKQPEIRARRLKYWHERYKQRIANDAELKAKRRRQQLDSYYLRHYGTTTPEPGARSVIDGRRYLGPKELRPPKPCPTKPSQSPAPTKSSPSSSTGRRSTASATNAASPPRTASQAPAQTRSTHSAAPSAPPSPRTTAKASTGSPPTNAKPWIPTPVSRWEPGLDRQAEREFYL